MLIVKRIRHIAAELKGHIPFTLLGVSLGIVFMLLFNGLDDSKKHILFSVFHPAHVVLSAMVTASMFRLHAAKKRIVSILLVGYFGSIGIATLSDIIIPHIGSELLGLNVPSHAALHHQDEDGEHAGEHGEGDVLGSCEHDGLHEHSDSGQSLHFAFIEQWYIINPAAILGIVIAFFLPRTKFPHAGHVLISTWASSSYMLMAAGHEITIAVWMGIFATLFLAVWLPCCISDIVFPLLFVKSDLELTEVCVCHNHAHHSHPHVHKHSQECSVGKEQDTTD